LHQTSLVELLFGREAANFKFPAKPEKSFQEGDSMRPISASLYKTEILYSAVTSHSAVTTRRHHERRVE
jgi:hypothetical protein